MSKLAVGCSIITLVWLTKSLAARYEILWIQFIKIVPILDHYIFSEQMEHTCSIKEIWICKLLTRQPPPSPSVPLPRIKNSSWSHENKGREAGQIFLVVLCKISVFKKNKEGYSGLDLLPSYLVVCCARTQFKSNVHGRAIIASESCLSLYGEDFVYLDNSFISPFLSHWLLLC